MKKKSKKINLPEFEFGSYVQNPAVDITESQIALAAAKNKASRNPWAMGTNILGNLAMQYGTSMMSQGMSEGQGVSSGGFNWGQLLQTGIGAAGAYANTQNFFANGGIVGIPTPIEAEGEEVIETPNGVVRELKGPSHAQGGIDMVVPSGTEIFSKKLKGEDGKTMAERKIDREKKLAKIERALKKNPDDATLQRTLKRLQSNNEKKEQKDMAIMQFAQMMSEAQKFATGGVVGGWPPMNWDWNTILANLPKQNGGIHPEPGYVPDIGEPVDNGGYPSIANNYTGGEDLQYPTITYNPDMATPPINDKEAKSDNPWMNALNLTAGDAVGMFGNLVSTFGPMRNTRAMRAGDTPNINPYENYGKDALNKIDQSKGFAAGVRDSQLQDLELTRNSSIRRGRNSARGINTLRALDLATDMGVNNAKTGIYNQYLQQIAGILAQEAGLENEQDRMVMSGNAQRDMNDRADRDAYFTAMATDIATQGTGLQKIGKDMNAIKSRNVTEDVLNQMYPNFEVDMMSGKITGKVTEEQVKGTTIYSNLPTKELKDKYLSGIIKKQYKWVDGKLYNKQGKELDITTLEPIT